MSAFDQHELTVAHVRECLGATRTPDEVVVVNDGGDPSLRDMLRPLSDGQITYARITTDIPWNQNGARNLGLFLSTGDLVSVEDNDHIPTRTFYEQALPLLGRVERVYAKKRLVISRDDLSKPQEAWTVLKSRGCAKMVSVMRREVLLRAKGFDEQFCGRYGWDVPDFMRRTRATEDSVGECYVVGDWWCNEQGRTFVKEGVTRMDPINYHHLRRNTKQGRTQSPIGILNFDYEVEVLRR